MTDHHTDAGSNGASRRRFLGMSVLGMAGLAGNTRTVGATRQRQQTPVVPAGPAVGLEPVAKGFDQPTDFAVPTGGDRMFVVDRIGTVFVVDGNGKPEQPFLDIADRMAEVDGEQGLLGIALHPKFRKNGKFYLRYSGPPTEKTPKPYSHNEVLAEFRTTEGKGDPDSERKLLSVPEPQSNHNGGAVTFGPDGYLYTSYGDGGKGNDAGTGHVADWYDANEGGNGQDVRENFLGSILRIDVDERSDGNPYAIPDDNPLVGKDGLDEHFAWGFRNPWRLGFSNGDLYVADVGQEKYEEVDIVRKGENYGWNVYEGTHCFDPDSGEEKTNDTSCPDSTPPSVRGGEALRMPVIEYPHSRDGKPLGKSVIGGYVYEGSVAALDGQYVFGDFVFGGTSAGALFAATPTKKGLWSFSKLDITTADDGELPGSLLSIGRDDENELYALTAGETGAVHRLVSRQLAGETTTDSGETTTDSGETTTGSGETTDETTTDSGETTDETTTDSGETTTGSGETTVGTTTDSGETTTGSGETTVGTNATSGSETSSTDGPGFGVLAALAGLAGIGLRALGDRE